MNDIMPAASLATRNKVLALEEAMKSLPQVQLHTEHVFHAGVYARTIRVPAGTLLTNTRIIIPTLLITSGHLLIFGESGVSEYVGHQIIPGGPGRQNAFYAIDEAVLTMVFATDAKTVEEAEKQFTDEPERLGSRREG